MQNVQGNPGSQSKKKSSNWFLIISVAVVLIILGLIALAMFGGPMRTYESKDYGVSISYPSNWELRENFEGTIAIFASPKETSMDLFQENVNIVAQDLSANPMTLEQYTETAIKQLEGVFNNVKIVEKENAKLADLPAYKIVYEATGDYNLKIMHVWAVLDNKVYTFTYSAELSKYDSHLIQVTAMLNSFKIK